LARFILTGGQVNDITQASSLIATVEPAAVLADKAYDSNTLLAYIETKKAKAVIPSKANRKVQRE
jgi:IS5 family transposase